MKLYQTVDGTLIGFYRERGGEVRASMYRDVYEMRPVTKTKEVEVWIESTFVSASVYLPGHYEEVPWERPGRLERRAVRIPEHEEEQLVEIPGYYERRYVQLPGQYEIKPVWFDEYYVTKYYWREAHPARGLEAAWIPYQELVPAGYSDTRVWVEGEYRAKIFWVDATWEHQMVTVPEAWGTETIWIEPISEIKREWIPDKWVNVSTGEHGHWEIQTVEYQDTERVWVGYEPVYEMIDQSQQTLYEVLELVPNAFPEEPYEDAIVIRNRLNGDELTTSAKYLGMAERIDENEYVVP